MSFLRNKLSRFHHLSEETISRLVSGELQALRTFRALRHLEKCWQCRARREAFERVAMQVAAHHELVVKGTPGNPDRRMALLAALRQRTEEAPPQAVMVRSLFLFPRRIGISMNPVLASAVIVFAATILMIWVWQRPSVTVNAAQLLRRAEISDLGAAGGKPGVVYQKVRIKTANSLIEREIYRDALGTRRRRPQSVQASVKPARQALLSAGVDWDVPLSVASYRDWHDRQPSVIDSVHSVDGNMLMLVSKSTDGPIRAESLTVRASDFHPVQRTIQTLSSGTIEIAELNYAVLDWNNVNEALFEPLPSPSGAFAALPGPGPLHVPVLPTAEQLEVAELQAKLELNRLHADEGEQINVVRTDREIEVKGVVETDERMHQIVSSLRQVPHVRTDVLSLTELQGRRDSEPSAQSVSVQSIDVHTSPLDRYLSGKAATGREVSDISASLLDSSLKIWRNAADLAAIESSRVEEAGSPSKLWVIGQLSQSYSGRLLEALEAQQATLQQLGFRAPETAATPATDVDLLAEAKRNDALCRELIAGSEGATRSGPEIAAEMFASIARIRSAATALQPAK